MVGRKDIGMVTIDPDKRVIVEREYQTKAVREILHHTIGLGQRTMFQLATGAGKTQIATQVMEQVIGNLDLAVAPLTQHNIFDNAPKASEGVVFMCHRIELIRQAERTLTQAGLPVHMSYNVPSSYGSDDIYKKGMVNIQSAGKIAGRRSRPIPFPSYLVVDEAHHAPAASWSRVLQSHRGQVLGLTATPWRLNPRQHFQDLFDYLITGQSIGASTRDLVSDQYLVEPVIMVPDEIVKYLPDDMVAGEVSMGRLSKRLGVTLIDIPLDEWFKRACYGRRRPLKTLFFAATQEIAINQTQILNENGVKAGVLLSDEELASLGGLREFQYDRDMVVHDFETNQLDAIVNCNIVSEGFDVPAVECVVVGRPTRSLAMYRQMIGRAMRPSDDKKVALVIDCGGSVRDDEVGHPMVEPYWSLAPRIDTPSLFPPIMKTCKECQSLNWAATQNCIACGNPFGKDCVRCGVWKSYNDYSMERKGEDEWGYRDKCIQCRNEEWENELRAERMKYSHIPVARRSTFSRLSLYEYNMRAITDRAEMHPEMYSTLMSVSRKEEYADANRTVAGEFGDVISPLILIKQERMPDGSVDKKEETLSGVVIADGRWDYNRGINSVRTSGTFFLDVLRPDDEVCASCNRVHAVIPEYIIQIMGSELCPAIRKAESHKEIAEAHLKVVYPNDDGEYGHPHGLPCKIRTKMPHLMRLDGLNGTINRFALAEKKEEVETAQLGFGF